MRKLIDSLLGARTQGAIIDAYRVANEELRDRVDELETRMAEIANCATHSSNGTSRKMARLAREALGL